MLNGFMFVHHVFCVQDKPQLRKLNGKRRLKVNCSPSGLSCVKKVYSPPYLKAEALSELYAKTEKCLKRFSSGYFLLMR
jgi:hypothetical protein